VTTPQPPTEPWPSRPPPEPPYLPTDHPGLAVPPGPAAFPRPPADTDNTTGPLPFPPRRPTGRGPLLVGVAVAAVLAVLTSGLALAIVRRPADESGSSPTTRAHGVPVRPPAGARPGPSTTAPAAPTPQPGTSPGGPGGATADAAVMAAELDRLERYVEQARGQTFVRAVEVTVLDPAAFRREVRTGFDEERDAMGRQGELLRAAGLVPPAYDAVAGGLQLVGDSALGFYDPRTARLVVRADGTFTPFLRHVLVHELTHALDDQRFHLDRPELEHVTDGRDWAFAALVEGSARRVENEYVAGLTRTDKAALDREERQLATAQQTSLAGIPLVLGRLQLSPYDYGEPFVRALLAQGGNAALDTALRRPPVTSEQVVDVGRYRADEAALAVDAPPAEGPPVDEGTLGQVMTGFLLHGRDTNALGALIDPGSDPQALADLMDRVGRGETDLSDLLSGLTGGSGGGFRPIDSPAGWGGDHYVVYRPAAGGVCLRVDWRMDTPDALGQLTTQLHQWADGDPRAQISQPAPDLVRATRCAPPS
jgi:hypothetical protein